MSKIFVKSQLLSSKDGLGFEEHKLSQNKQIKYSTNWHNEKQGNKFTPLFSKIMDRQLGSTKASLEDFLIKDNPLKNLEGVHEDNVDTQIFNRTMDAEQEKYIQINKITVKDQNKKDIEKFIQAREQTTFQPPQLPFGKKRNNNTSTVSLFETSMPKLNVKRHKIVKKSDENQESKKQAKENIIEDVDNSQ